MEKEKKKKKLPKVLGIIAFIILILALIIVKNASHNMKEMRASLDDGLSIVRSAYEVTPADAGEFSEIKIYGLMKFHVKQYDVKGLGNLSVMTVNMGFMQMSSFVITPYEKDVPMLSMDFMYIMGQRKTYTEYYDLTADKNAPAYKAVLDALRDMTDKYSDIEDLQTEPAWYDDLMTVSMHKKPSKNNRSKVGDIFSDSISAYITASKDAELLSDEDKAKKLEITQSYCDDLIQKGGVSTDVFKKELGEDKTKEFFDKVFFGTEPARNK